MKQQWLFVSVGFALFSMFFGSGNLVFPIAVGKESGGHLLLATLGILCTGVLVPFLGVWGMVLYRGDIGGFFSSFGRRGTFFFSLAALALMGPFGVMARCLTVAHGALLLLWPQASLPLTSLVLCALIYVMTLNKGKIVTLLGTVLTPLLLLAIGLITYFGLNGVAASPPLPGEGWQAFVNGYLHGYQTMDLLAAFFFSGFVIQHLTSCSGDEEYRLRVFYRAAAVGAAILSAVYCALVLLGWAYAPLLATTLPQEMLGAIALEALGPLAAPCVCLAVLFACLTTAIVLVSLFADFLRAEVLQYRLSRSHALLVTLAIGFAVSTLDFAGIARFLGPLLETTYPALIALTLVNIGSHYWGRRPSHWPFTVTLALKLLWV